ncbi:putative biosynthetic protein, family [Tritonibacter multivorans]|uniref:Putative biosynthetic protein, family n=1 Tax=Tritonibacter multivorans TaxID=928856 RepID=A0A0P1GBA9_9RHOB|nr:Pnap_2097 family protein [Tritonibacter multivorans]MDA7421999.1 hypothetical protein [Tritonibacter multivorans]CUH78691.1 putative biosynthetic protein, family [Tritonibacter multivorans]SFD65982.1 probable biosynthetic protein, Pnap_2097 family [Tritonibacter multivorans]
MNIAPRTACLPHERLGQMTLGMAQLAPRGLSEDWWLKHLGDVHWQLIAEAVGQNTTVFRDRQGRQLYAAFCATEFAQSHPDRVGLGQNLDIRSTLWSVGHSRIQSNHRILAEGVEVAQVRLVSTFVAHMKANVNASVSRATPYLVPVLDPAPDDFARQAGQLAKSEKQTRHTGADHVALSTTVGADFNAVGLLYFPSFTRLLEQAEVAFADGTPWRPVKRRLVLYFGNIEMGDSVLGVQPFDMEGQMSLQHICASTGQKRAIAFGQTSRH